MQRNVLLSLHGNSILIDQSSLDVLIGDTVAFISSDGNQYDIVIPNKDNFFVNNDNGATIEGMADQNIDLITNAVNNKPVGTTKYYSVTTPGGGVPLAPPRIIVIE